jgi:hypothetical protein
MKKLFVLNEDNVKIFPANHFEEANKHFNEGWWKGFTVAGIATWTGFIIGTIIVGIVESKEKA